MEELFVAIRPKEAVADLNKVLTYMYGYGFQDNTVVRKGGGGGGGGDLFLLLSWRAASRYVSFCPLGQRLIPHPLVLP